MACCLIVAYLLARAYDNLLRLAIYWGLKAPPPRWRGGTARDRFRRLTHRPAHAAIRDA